MEAQKLKYSIIDTVYYSNICVYTHKKKRQK